MIRFYDTHSKNEDKLLANIHRLLANNTLCIHFVWIIYGSGFFDIGLLLQWLLWPIYLANEAIVRIFHEISYHFNEKIFKIVAALLLSVVFWCNNLFFIF